MLLKFITKLFLNTYLKKAFIYEGRLFVDFYFLGETAKKLRKYDDIYDVYFYSTGLYSSFHSEGIERSLHDINEFYWLYDDYKSYLETEDRKLFKRTMWFLICCCAFREGYDLKEFNYKSKYYSDLKEMLLWVLGNPIGFSARFNKEFDRVVELLNKLEKDLIRYQKRYQKEELEQKKYEESDEWKKICDEVESEIKKDEKKREVIEKRKAEIVLKERKKQLGITADGPIVFEKLNKEQRKIWHEMNKETLKKVGKLIPIATKR